MDLPSLDDTRSWRLIRDETLIFWDLLITPSNGFACPRCEHTVFTPIDGHDGLTCADPYLVSMNQPKLIGVVGLANPQKVYR